MRHLMRPLYTSLLTAIAALSLTACLPKKSSDHSGSKDFAYNPNGKNFAVVAGNGGATANDVIYDASNWENMIKRQQLGIFKPVYIEKRNATVADLTRVFEQIGREMDESSTIMFAYSGPGKEGKLQADREFTYQELADALAKGAGATKKARRFYMFVESSIGPDGATAAEFSKRHMDAVYGAFNTAERARKLFEEALVFVSTTTDQNAAAAVTSSYYGRFSYEFVSSLDNAVRQLAQNRQASPTLERFFSGIVTTTNKTAGRNATYSVRPKELLAQTLFAKDFVPPIEPVVPQPSVPATPNQPQAANSPALELQLQGGTATTLGQAFTTDTALVEISASWCGPCMQLAQTLASQPSSKCGVVTLIVTDNGSSLEDWKSMAQQSSSGEASTISSHSYGVGSSESLRTWLSTLQGQQVEIKFFPTLFALSRGGQVLAVGQNEARAACN